MLISSKILSIVNFFAGLGMLFARVNLIIKFIQLSLEHIVHPQIIVLTRSSLSISPAISSFVGAYINVTCSRFFLLNALKMMTAIHIMLRHYFSHF